MKKFFFFACLGLLLEACTPSQIVVYQNEPSGNGTGTPENGGGQGGGGTNQGGGGQGGGGIAVPEGLMAYYPFDNDNTYDATTHELDGVAINRPSFIEDTPSGEGKALSLNWDSEQYVNIPYNPFKSLYNYTITLWIKDFGVGVIFSAVSDGDYNPNYPNNTRSDYPRLISTASNSFRFYTGYDNWDTTESFIFDTFTIMADGWHHIGLTCQYGSNSNEATRKLYVDGRLIDTNPGFMHGEPYVEWAPNTIQIGGNRNGVYETATSMKLDNIRFYNLALSKEKIKEIYESEK